MVSSSYFGTYARFDTLSKKEAAMLMGADNLVGDRFSIAFDACEGRPRAWLQNKFGAKVGYFDPALSRQLSVMAARGWQLCALLAFVAFTDYPEPGFYWGQAAVVAFDPALDEPMDVFLGKVGARLREGVRPEVNLGEQAVESIVGSGGTWQPKATVPLPERKAGTVIMKQRQNFTERLVEQGRQRNKGCYVASWAFIIAVVVLAVLGLRACGLF